MILANRLYDTSCHVITIPGGAKANIFIVEDLVDGFMRPVLVQCNIGRVGTRMAGYGRTVADLLTEMLSNQTIDECIGVLAKLSLDIAEYEADVDSNAVRSLPEAFWVALSHYKRMREL